MSAQAKNLKMRPRPVSEEKEVEELDQERVHVISKYSVKEIG